MIPCEELFHISKELKTAIAMNFIVLKQENGSLASLRSNGNIKQQ